MNKGMLLGVLVFFLVVIMMPDESRAVPSYARQVQKPCTACHTIWPNLNQYGRQFKVKAYTDVSEKWEMINKDNMNLATIFPFSARVLYFPENREDNNAAGIHQSSTSVDSVQLFIASRAYDYAGVFASAEWSPDDNGWHLPTAKVAFQYPLGEGNTIGLVAFKGLSAAADPFNSLGGRDRDLVWGDESTPFVLTQGWTFSFWSEGNVGTVAHGYFLGNRLYAAIGVMRGGLASDASLGLQNTSNPSGAVADTDPNDWYTRIAWDQKLPNGAVTFGAAYYDGKQRILDPAANFIPLYDTKVKRLYFDASLEQNYGEDHMVEVQALLGSGKETNVFGGGEERKFNGAYLQVSYFYDRKIGLVASINSIKFKDAFATEPDGSPGVDSKNSMLTAVEFLPWLNTKFALQYVTTKTKFVDLTAAPDQTEKITRIVMDVAF
jgi:hypothetical protein